MGRKTEQKAEEIGMSQGSLTQIVQTAERALSDRVLEALGSASRSTKEVVALVGGEAQPVYRALRSLQGLGKVKSIREHRPTAMGALGRVWTRCDAMPRAPIPPQDPLLWALFRRPEQASL